jgi:pimeloyl-ACP methyl ester carboxylesterase
MNARLDPSILPASGLRFAALPSGIRLPYLACGSGEPLLFVHGSLCDYRYWDSQTGALAHRFHCIAVSLSHYWPLADANPGTEFSWDQHVEELAEFIAVADIGPVHLVGHSRGGCVAFQLARRYPHLVKTLTLADPGGPLHSEETMPAEAVALRADVARLIEQGKLEAGLEMFVDSVSMPGMWRRSPPDFRTMAMNNAATLPKQFRDPLPAYCGAAAAEVRCRTLLMAGAKSPRMYHDNVAQLAQWMAGADQRIIAGASHGMNLTHPAAFNRLLQAFIDR